MPVSLVTAPQGWPVSVDEAKHQVLQGDVVDDAIIGLTYIPSATERCENATRRALLTQTWDLILDRFPSETYIEIPKPPLQSVTHVKYYDQQGTLQTMTVNTDYIVQAPAGARCRRGRVALPFAKTWPIAKTQMGSVLVRFVCGYGTAFDVPAILRGAILQDVGTHYANREGAVLSGDRIGLIPGGPDAVYVSYRSLARQRRDE